MGRARPPNIRPRGFRVSAPPGFIIGRMPNSGHGPVQFLDINSLRQMGVASAASQAAQQAVGFGFNEAGLMAAGELLGQGQWSRDIKFSASDDYSLACQTPAALLSTMIIKAVLAGVPTQIGTIAWPAHALTGVLTWTAGDYTLTAHTTLQLYAPTVADAALAGCSGTVNGHYA